MRGGLPPRSHTAPHHSRTAGGKPPPPGLPHGAALRRPSASRPKISGQSKTARLASERRRLNLSLLFSALLHALLLSLAIGGQGPGLLPSFTFLWQQRWVEAPNLNITLRPPRSAAVATVATPKTTPAPATQTAAPPRPAPGSFASSLRHDSAPGAAAQAEAPAIATETPAPIAETRPAPPKPVSHTPVIALEQSRDKSFVVPPPTPEPPSETPASPSPPPPEPAEAEPEPAASAAEAEQAARQQEAARAEAARQDAERREAERQAAEKLAAQQREAAQREAARAEAARQDAERREAERQAAEKLAAQQREAARQEAARAEAARQDAERRETERQAAEKLAAQQREAARQEAARAEAARQDAERRETERQAAEKLAAQQREAAQHEAARAEAARREAERTRAEQEEEQRLARRRAVGRQLDEEAAQREAAANAPASSRLPLSLSTARRARLWGRSDPNAELIRHAEAWVRKIQLNTPVDTVRQLASLRHTPPLVAVALRSDGSVEAVTFVVSSGVAEVDEAVRRIVMNNVPYPGFSPALARQYDVVEIRRTWRFDNAVRLD